MRCAALILLVLITCCGATCSTKPTPPTIPEIVRVPVITYVPLPAEVTRDCEDVAKQSNSYGEAVRLANARKAALDECSGRMRQIRDLQPEGQGADARAPHAKSYDYARAKPGRPGQRPHRIPLFESDHR